MSGIEHGGALDTAMARHGGTRADWLDLSTGINPVPWPVPELPPEAWTRLPDRALLRDCLAAARTCYRVPDHAAIVAAPGTQAILQWLPHLFPGRDASVVEPAYGEYAETFRLAGRAVTGIASLRSESGEATVVIAGHPNNPDGRLVAAADLQAVLALGGTAVIDEAFGDVAPEASLVPLAGVPGLVILKSFGKFFGLAGLRLGFAIGAPETMDRLQALLGPWAVSGPALEVGGRALGDAAWIAATRLRLAADRSRLEALLAAQGFSAVGGTDLFVTVRHERAGAIREELAARHILVRGFSHSPDWLRFGLPADEGQFARLGDALAGAVRA